MMLYGERAWSQPPWPWLTWCRGLTWHEIRANSRHNTPPPLFTLPSSIPSFLHPAYSRCWSYRTPQPHCTGECHRSASADTAYPFHFYTVTCETKLAMPYSITLCSVTLCYLLPCCSPCLRTTELTVQWLDRNPCATSLSSNLSKLYFPLLNQSLCIIC